MKCSNLACKMVKDRLYIQNKLQVISSSNYSLLILMNKSYSKNNKVHSVLKPMTKFLMIFSKNNLNGNLLKII